MYSAPLLTSRKDLADCGLALVGVGNDQLDTTQAPLAQAAQEVQLQKTWASESPSPCREFPAACPG